MVTNMNPLYSEFKRKFSLPTYKTFKIKLGEMTFCKDFVNDNRGDPYPLSEKSEDCLEVIEHNEYRVEQGRAERLICQFFPFATYEATFSLLEGEVGFCIRLPDAEALVACNGKDLTYACGDHKESLPLKTPQKEMTLIVSCRLGAFDVYFKVNGKAEHFATFCEDAFVDSNQESVFTNSYAFLRVSGGATVKEVLSYIDSGVSIADIRPIKYEDGSVILKDGAVFFTASIRLHEGNYQSIFSWIPGTEELKMTGILFFDKGDGKWSNYIASSLLYDRRKELWYVWVSSFSHEHILAHGAFEGDPRFGISVVDVKIMEKATETSDVTDFVGFRKDEDPDFFYDSEKGKWILGICRSDPILKTYVYVFFESEDPFENYKCIGRVKAGSETGGSFVKYNGELFFVCGNEFSRTSEYRIYGKDGMKLAKFNYPDGGFRGWGSVFPVKMGSRTRYFWLTFDRHNGSGYNWSYGNIYCFEASE